MAATFTVDAYPNDKFTGVVRQVRNSPQTVQNVVTYDAVIDVGNPEFRLKPGMTANCTFVWAEKDDALRIPNAAMRFRPPAELLASLRASSAGGTRGQGGVAEGGQAGRTSRPTAQAAPVDPDRKTVWVLRDGKPRPVRIRVGVTDGSLTDVAEGELNEGDLVITDMSGGGSAGQQAGFPRRMF